MSEPTVPAGSVREDELREFLLGGLGEARRDQIEEQLFADDGLYEHVLEVQYDLIDQHARGALSPQERQAVEQRLLGHPDADARIQLARALARRDQGGARLLAGAPGTMAAPSAGYSPQTARIGRVEVATPTAGSGSGRASTSWSWVLTAAAAVLALVGLGLSAWLGIENSRLRRELSARGGETPPSPPAAGTPTPEVPRTELPIVATVVLAPQVLRGESVRPTVQIAAGATFVRTELNIDDTAGSFTLAVERAGVGRVWSRTGLTERLDGALVVWMPAEVLQAGDYELVLWRGAEEAPSALEATFAFRVEER